MDIQTIDQYHVIEEFRKNFHDEIWSQVSWLGQFKENKNKKISQVVYWFEYYKVRFSLVIYYFICYELFEIIKYKIFLFPISISIW